MLSTIARGSSREDPSTSYLGTADSRQNQDCDKYTKERVEQGTSVRGKTLAPQSEGNFTESEQDGLSHWSTWYQKGLTRCEVLPVALCWLRELSAAPGVGTRLCRRVWDRLLWADRQQTMPGPVAFWPYMRQGKPVEGKHKDFHD